MRYFFAACAAVLLAVPAARATAAADVKLSGCVVKGEGQGFLLTNAPGEPAFESARSARIEPGPVGTSGASATVLYWLDDDHDLAKQVGHTVEVSGELRGDVKAGEIKISPKPDWTELKANGPKVGG